MTVDANVGTYYFATDFSPEKLDIPAIQQNMELAQPAPEQAPAKDTGMDKAPEKEAPSPEKDIEPEQER